MGFDTKHLLHRGIHSSKTERKHEVVINTIRDIIVEKDKGKENCTHYNVLFECIYKSMCLNVCTMPYSKDNYMLIFEDNFSISI